MDRDQIHLLYVISQISACSTEFIIPNSLIADALHNLHETFQSDEFNYWIMLPIIYTWIIQFVAYPGCFFENIKILHICNADVWPRISPLPVVE